MERSDGKEGNCLIMWLSTDQRVQILNQRWEFIKEDKKVRKQENKNSTKKVIKKKRKFFLFSWSLSLSSSCFLDRFLGRILVFLFSYFIVLFCKFPPQYTHTLIKSRIDLIFFLKKHNFWWTPCINIYDDLST